MFFIWCTLFAVCLPLITSSNIECGNEHFPCDSNDQCVEKGKWCDKKRDCDDKSDEAYCKEAGWWTPDPNSCKKITETHILCGSGICIPIAAQCDKIKDCDDGYDEKYCEPTTTTTETIESPAETTTFKEASASKIYSLNSASTRHYKEIESVPTTTTSTSDEVYSSRVNGYRDTGTSYYEKRMKEVDSETKNKSPPPTFPKTVPTVPYVATRSTIPPAPGTYPRNFIKTTTSTTSTTTTRQPRTLVTEPRSQSSHPSRHAQPRQRVEPHTNRYQPPINHYQLSNNNYRPLTNHHQAPSNRNQLNYHQPYQPPNNYQLPYQPHTNHYQSPSFTNYNEHRPLNGEPDARFQTNYFKSYNAHQEVNRPFYFAKDYAALHGRENARSIREGAEWILRQRSDAGDWGRDTPRALVALALANSSFLNGSSDDEIIKRRFMIQLGADLLRNNTKNFNIIRMSMAINGLLAVCEDPTDFHGMDLTEMLRYKRRENDKSRSYLSPFVSLSLCLSNKSLSSSEVHDLMKQMAPSANTNERTKDMKIAAIMAFSCYVHQSTSEDPSYRASLRGTLRSAIANLLEHIGEDGDFGSVYSTALAAQALMSTNESSNWNGEKTMSFLKQQQREDGSFGDLLATYFVLPALSGRSLLHLRNIPCNPVKRELTPQEILDFAGPKQYVRYSLLFGYPLVNTQSLYLLVPRGINFLDVMRVAEYQDQNFRFALENNSFKVYSLSGLPNDPEMGLSWHLYVKHESSAYTHEPNSREKFTGDVRSLSPRPDEHLIFWYHTNELRI